jgi:hypothetical protein
MNRIEFLKDNKIKLNGITYKPYKVCELPNQFGLTQEDEFGNKYSPINEWFNYKGLTYIIE